MNLAFSELTNRVYLVNGTGRVKTDVTDQVVAIAKKLPPDVCSLNIDDLLAIYFSAYEKHLLEVHGVGGDDFEDIPNSEKDSMAAGVAAVAAAIEGRAA